MRKTLAIAFLAVPFVTGAASAQTALLNKGISEPEVLAAQKGWCSALVQISDTYAAKGLPEAKQLASKVVDEAYGYQMGPVLFKPTLAAAPQSFRTTREGAISYFVGGDQAFPHDHGFATKNWKKCDIENAAVFIAGDTATTMGNVRFTDKDGKVTVVDKTWEFVKDNEGKLRIMVHHSSLPFVGD